MEENPEDQEILEAGKTTPQETRYLFISDAHCERRDKDAEEIAGKVEEYGEEHECGVLLMGGDMGGSSDIKKFLETDFEEKKIVKGNHDTWWLGDFAGDKSLSDLELEAGKDYDHEEIEWEDKMYKMCLKHKPGDFNISHSTKKENEDNESWVYDIILYGHSHIPHTRCLTDGTLAICPGSIEKNNHRVEEQYKTVEGEMPERSAHIITTFSEGVTVQHIDYDEEDIVEEKLYIRENGILKPAA
ncbi:MAG: metallophosphoesterase family protein [Candidatus Nanohaloarchaea archaeon]|nr:metallophosphoesterase family protein [Candidatus Nanohaloarchaea archaeon]